ncbi:glucan endo-1,3-beta-glucosidase 12 [Magnolia sinica]|uniref:glucan endo-1,3-beta-glucosidase 12 n=1 Tax=Magnolia sinica TaxID=86752 RepID=UPI0026581A4D|nr:glucan endo-1,3-beta-glucosidase 12 [Magnolia sinica]
MLKTVGFLLLLSLSLGLAGQDSVKLINLYDPPHLFHPSLTYTNVPVYISLRNTDIYTLSSTPSMAKTWLKTHIPTAPKPTTIVVGKGLLCIKNHQNQWGLVLPTMKNMDHAIKNLGLDKHIKVSAAFSNDCLDRDGSMLKPLLDFLKSSNTQYLIDPPPHFSSSLNEIISLVSSHENHIKTLGFSMSGINVIISHFRENPIKRKLSFTEPYPERPTPQPVQGPPSPIHSSVGFSAPSEENPIPPSPQIVATSPGGSFSFAPDGPPIVVPGNPPDVSIEGPPCLAAGPAPDARDRGEERGLWCVAKPSVPSDVLQESMDYACGEGGADCEEIGPHGSCYSPDTMVAHASYAFNSYWQKNKKSGGTCSFGGTAMIINADPSFLHCRFLLL